MSGSLKTSYSARENLYRGIPLVRQNKTIFIHENEADDNSYF